jgi:hypothetical protein
MSWRSVSRTLWCTVARSGTSSRLAVVSVVEVRVVEVRAVVLEGVVLGAAGLTVAVLTGAPPGGVRAPGRPARSILERPIARDVAPV